MKNLIIFILLVPYIASCQEPTNHSSALVQYMVNENYISVFESNSTRNDSLFTSIYDIYLKRYGLNRGEIRRRYFSSSESKDKTGKLINKIYELGLIDEPTFNDIQLKYENRDKNSRLVSASISDEFMLFQYLFELEQVKGKTELVKSYLQELKHLGLISPFEQVDKDYSSKEDFINLFSKKLIIHIDSLPESIPECYRSAYYSIEKLDPNLKISNYSFAIEDVQFEYSKYQSADVRFSNSGVEYKTNNYYNKGYNKTVVYEKIDRRFFRVFNKVLADQKSDYRIMDIERTDKNIICLILISNEQFEFLKETDNRTDFVYFDPEWYKIEVSKYWNPFTLLNQQETEKYFTLFNSIGLFKHLNGAQKENELERLKNAYLHSGESILYEMDNICLVFDWEMFDEDKPYKKAIKEFATITHGEFDPVNIHDNFSFSGETADISFDFNGKTYRKTVEVTGDWYSVGFLDLINTAMEENKLKGRFYDLPDGGQASIHIYLTKEQYEFLKSKSLLKFYKEEN